MFAKANNGQKFMVIGGIATKILFYWSLLVNFWTLLFKTTVCLSQSLCEINMSKSESMALQPCYVICSFFGNQCGRCGSALRLTGDSILSAESTILKR